MPSLATHIDSLNFSRQLNTVKDLIDAAQPRTTFWGNRIVEIRGFTGSISLDNLVRKVSEASNQRCEADDLTLAERIAGIDIEKRLTKFYQMTDIQIKNSNFFTRFLNWLREFSFVPYTTRFYLEHNSSYFQAYSRTKFLQQFGGTCDELGGGHPASCGAFGPPPRIVAEEARIRALLASA